MSVAIEWSESSLEGGGVDHLGMRVASEAAYAQLFDFTTTVAWRPRYFSFLCWATERAFLGAGGSRDDTEYDIDEVKYRRLLKKADYTLAAATPLRDPKTRQVGGSDKILSRLNELPPGNEAQVEIADDHLGARNGSLSIYAGPMRQLGLLETAQGFDRPTTTGLRLAAAFGASLGRSGTAAIFDRDLTQRGDLVRLGSVCGFDRLTPAASELHEVFEERERLRELIVGDRTRLERLNSIGMLLALCSALTDEVDVGLEHFRELCLLGRARGRPIDLGDRWPNTRRAWGMYQAHAYATYALEALLAVVLVWAQRIGAKLGLDSAPLDNVRAAVLDGPARGVGLAEGVPDVLTGWYSRPLAETITHLRAEAQRGAGAPVAEPEFHRAISRIRTDSAPSDDLNAYAHDAALMYLLCAVRLSMLLDGNGDAAWLGSTDRSRRPPLVLAEHLRLADHTAPTHIYLRRVLDDLVIGQHRTNAHRKLAADPSRDTSKFLLEDGRMTRLEGHGAGTSNPRFENVVTFLQDLGYLRPGRRALLTVDGLALEAKLGSVG